MLSSVYLHQSSARLGLFYIKPNLNISLFSSARLVYNPNVTELLPVKQILIGPLAIIKNALYNFFQKENKFIIVIIKIGYFKKNKVRLLKLLG